ncbi:hypothetical protein N7478_002283 [Penicillium angulare]|uniref:uncharacterized protein n=1 Tax=Penicillium angulare TaxID=116970 RepID=UPI0025409771|nr:uncharacterized protein N7478_002283 [Penicillium angulare]KAJ5286597.1 hypothetical protein N7478_002283 [Penicillium angulare]
MAHPTSRGAYPLPGAFGTSRERESFRYLPPYHLQAQPLPHIDQDTQPTPSVARSSLDPALTSFAQLGTFRLNAKRTLISLFGRSAQFVLTEATSNLGLSGDPSDNERQGLWIGCCTVNYQRSLCKSLVKHSQTTGDIYQPLVVTDLSQDDELKDHTDVVNQPHMRFMACSPIVSPKGILIGSYTVLDDKPHDPLDHGSMKFLTDIACTVMDHLDATRSRHDYLRSERMIVGLGSFLEGKGSLRNAWIHEHESAFTPISPGEDLDREGHINQAQQQKQVLEHDLLATAAHNNQIELPFRPQNFDTTRSQKPISLGTQSNLLATSTIESRDYFYPRHRRGSHTAIAPSFKGSQKQPPKAKHATKIKETFSRAANIVRESMEVEAVVFFDANFRSPHALVKPPKNDADSGSNLESCSSSEEEAKGRGIPPLQELSSGPEPKNCGKDSVDPCEILGFATSEVSSVNKERLTNNTVAISETFLAQLLRRYPRGRVFNFGADGSISSDDTSDGNLPRNGAKKFKRTRKSYLRQDGATLRQLAPNARSIVFSPLWDSHKERWYSGCLTWTKAPYRAPTTNDDLAFLFAFGHSLMAEIHRLGALLTERAKSDLLAGISHELRSPLHGIFGTVDILNDTAMDVLQRGFMHTISSCAFTLLGSIDQLLEYASINDVQPKPKNAEPRIPRNLATASDGESHGESQLKKTDQYSIVQLDAVVEDAIETVFAGYSFLKATDTRNPVPSNGSAFNPFDFEDNVKVVLDIDRSKKLKFAARPGAWHVILTNFFGNALKFTEEGFIYVSLKADPVKFDADGEALQSKITLCIKDTGCGMEEEFLKNELFTAFSKEDKLTIGNGLGINIVNRIVSSLGGEIQITSQKGVGTEVVTTVTLDHVSQDSLPLGSSNNEPFSPATRAFVNEKTIGIILHTTSDGDAALLSATHRVCENWFQMKVELVDPSDIHLGHCDFYIALHESLALGNHGILPIRNRYRGRASPPVIIICSSQRIAHELASQDRKNSGVFEFISQPCGPYKLAKSLEICVQRQLLRDDSSHRSPFAPSPNSMASDIQSYGKMIQDSTSHNMSLLNTPSGPLKTLPKEAITNSLTPPAFLVTPGWDQNAAAEDYLSVQPCHRIIPGTILLVDDNEINIKILVAYMKKLGYCYAAARNGQEALDFFKANARVVEVILMDISMPVMDGIESTRRIREFEKTVQDKERTLIIALTGVAQVETERAAVASGMDTFLTKPARLDSLLPLIEPRLPRPETGNAGR